MLNFAKDSFYIMGGYLVLNYIKGSININLFKLSRSIFRNRHIIQNKIVIWGFDELGKEGRKRKNENVPLKSQLTM